MTRRIIAISNKGGYSLIEMLVAMAILAIVAVALMRSQLVVMQKNIQNEMRDEAVRIAEQRMNEMRSGPGGFDGANPDNRACDSAPDSHVHIDLVVENVGLCDAHRNVRSADVVYHLQKNVVSLDGNTKQASLTVTWTLRGQSYSHFITSIVSNR